MITVFAGCENAAPAAAQSATLLYVTPVNIHNNVRIA